MLYLASGDEPTCLSNRLVSQPFLTKMKDSWLYLIGAVWKQSCGKQLSCRIMWCLPETQPNSYVVWLRQRQDTLPTSQYGTKFSASPATTRHSPTVGLMLIVHRLRPWLYIKTISHVGQWLVFTRLSRLSCLRVATAPLSRSGWGSKVTGTGFESRQGRSFVIEVVHIQCSKYKRTGVCSAVYGTVKNPWRHSIRVGHNPEFGLPSVAIFPRLCRKRRKQYSFLSEGCHLKVVLVSIASSKGL